MIDLFGTKPAFNYKRKESSKTACGVFATYAFISFTLWSIYHVGNDIFYKQNPKAYQNDQFFEDPEPTHISPDTFNVAFGLQDPNTYAHYINESIYSVVATWRQIKRVTNPITGNVEMIFNEIPITLERCTPEHFGTLSEKAKALELPNLHCFRKEDKELLRVQGRFESPYYEYITVDYAPCKNGGSVVCAPQEEINAKLDGAYFAMYFTDLAIDPQNYTNPEGKFVDSKFTTFGQKYYTEYALFLRHVSGSSPL